LLLFINELTLTKSVRHPTFPSGFHFDTRTAAVSLKYFVFALHSKLPLEIYRDNVRACILPKGADEFPRFSINSCLSFSQHHAQLLCSTAIVYRSHITTRVYVAPSRTTCRVIILFPLPKRPQMPILGRTLSGSEDATVIERP